MANKDAKFNVVLALVLSFFGGGAAALVSWIAYGSPNSTAHAGAIVVAFFVGALVTLGAGAVIFDATVGKAQRAYLAEQEVLRAQAERDRLEREAAAEAEAEARRVAEDAARAFRAAQEARAEVVRQRDKAEVAIVKHARQAVELTEHMAQSLRIAQSKTLLAQECQKKRSFDPFWEAIEEAYQELSAYSDSATRIAAHAAAHGRQVEEFAANGGDPRGVDSFPVLLDAESIKQNLGSATKTLGDMVQEAHSDFQFAYIFAERRTTAAVISGFASLSGAVSGMHGALIDSLDKLTTEVALSQARIANTLDRVAADSQRASDQSMEEMKQLRAAAERTRNAVVDISFGRPSLF